MKIEFLDDDDIEECNDFHNRAYDTNRSLKQWHWQFDGLIGGRRPFIVAKDGGRIVGTHALMPIKMINSKEVFLTAKSEETLVDSSMRGRGVFQKMYEPLMSFIHEQDVRSVWGFTPANKSFENIGFYVPGKTSQLVHPLSHRAFDVFQSQIQSGIKRPLFKVAIGMASILSATRLAMASRHNSEIEIKIIEEPIFDADIFCKKFVSDWGGVTIFRDQKYLQWRYFDNHKVKATLIGA
jgi:predicted GNAT family acetyltransferase